VSRVRELQEEAGRMKLGVSVLDQMMPLVREGLGLDVSHAYTVRPTENGADIDYYRYWNVSQSAVAHRLVRNFFTRPRRRWGLFDPLRPEARQRNRAVKVALGDWVGPDPEAVARKLAPSLRRLGVGPTLATTVAESMHHAFKNVFEPLGHSEYHQLRALVCDGEELLAWVGGFCADPVTPRQVSMLQALVPVLRDRLRLERHLTEVVVNRAALAAALERLPGAALLVDQRGAIRHANCAGRHLLHTRRADTLDALGRALGGGNSSFELTSLKVPGGPRHYLAFERPRPPSDAAAAASRAAARWALTPRQTEVLAHLCQGHSNRTIAACLGCAEKTVEHHVSAILERADMASRAELAAAVWCRVDR